MARIQRLESHPNRLLRAVSASSAITFGCDAPYRFGRVGFSEVGFAHIQTVGFTGFARERDMSAIVPIARQHILRAVSDAGLPVDALELRITIGIKSRERLFVDENPSSPTEGKRKRGREIRFYLEIPDYRIARQFRETLPAVYL